MALLEQKFSYNIFAYYFKANRHNTEFLLVKYNWTTNILKTYSKSKQIQESRNLSILLSFKKFVNSIKLCIIFIFFMHLSDKAEDISFEKYNLTNQYWKSNLFPQSFRSYKTFNY